MQAHQLHTSRNVYDPCRSRGFCRLALTALCLASLPARAQTTAPATQEGPPLPDRLAKAPATQPAGDSATSTRATTTPATTAPVSEDDQPKEIPLAFTNAPVDQIAAFLSEHLGKPVIAAKDLDKNIKVTLVNTKQLPVSEALEILTTALHEYGLTIDRRARTIHLIPIDQVNKAQIETVPANVDLSTIKPASKIIRKFFEIEHYDPAKLMKVLEPLIPGFGHLTADPSSKKLIVVDTVEHLMTLAEIIEDLDQPDSGGGEIRIFTVKHRDVMEVVVVLRQLIGGYLGVEIKSVSTSSGTSNGARPSGVPSRGGRPPGGPSGGANPDSAGTVTIAASKTPVLLIPQPSRSAIIALAASDVLANIEAWLEHLDQAKPTQNQTETVLVEYGDPEEVSQQLNEMLDVLPDEGLRNAVKIVPFGMSRRLMIIGSEDNRKLVLKWLEEIDVEDAGQRITKTFTLDYADANTIAENIKELFAEDSEGSGYRGYSYYYYMSRRTQPPERDKVTVTPNVRNNSVTVVAAPEKMSRIESQLEEWDKPLDGDQAAAKVIELKYTDPAEIKDILEALYTKKESSLNLPYWMQDDYDQETPSPVGRLFGQFIFQAYPETGKLIVISKNEENYRVIEELVADLDKPQSIGLPRVIKLQYADAESLAEQLNALLNAPGSPTSILRRQNLDDFSSGESSASPFSEGANQQPQQQPQPQQSDQGGGTGQMSFWWSSPPSTVESKQPSNLVGKIRVMPRAEQNELLIAAPEEVGDAIVDFVEKLDRPGYQVLIKAVIVEVVHDDSMSLGYRFSSDPSLFTTGDDPAVTENALRGLLNYSFQDNYGQMHQLTLNVDVNNLISLLSKVTDVTIKSEPKILTKDNVEGEFFDGQDIPFIKETSFNSLGNLNQTFDYFAVGIRLKVRPHITSEGNIDLTVNLMLSSTIPGRTLFGGAIVDRRETTTRLVLEDGHTFLMSGILRSEERAIHRGIPGLKDIPLLGELFKHREMANINTELLLFLTPTVVGPNTGRDAIEAAPLQRLESHGISQQTGEATSPVTATDAKEPATK